MLYKVLTNIGLTEKESLIYLALLELGAASAFDISKKNNIPYSTVHVNLTNLEQKELITKYEQNKTSQFSVLGPNALIHYLEKKKKDIDEKQKELEHAFSELSARYLSTQERPRLRLYEGRQGVELLENDVDEEFDRLKSPIVYTFSPIDIVKEFDPTSKNVSRRIQRGQYLKLIYTHKLGPQNLTSKKELREARFLSREQFPFNSAVVISPNQGIRLYSYRKHFIGVWIENQDMANTLKTIFDICWRVAKKEK